MTLTKDQELVVNFYNNIGNAFKGSLLDIQEGPKVNNFIYKPDDNFNMNKATKLAQLVSGRVRPDYNNQTVVFEVPKEVGQTISLNKLLQSKEFQTSKATLPVVLGTDTLGNIMISDLQKFPHLLIGGRTGSGKTNLLKSMLKSLSEKLKPSECQFIIIDPKSVEFAGINKWEKEKHLYMPIINDTYEAINILKSMVQTMEERYQILKQHKVKTIKEYKEKTHKNDMPYIIVAIDELADLMVIAKKDVESNIQYLLQKARATGIHLVIATQRCSSDVITNIIKANCPTRVSFQTQTGKDSNAILDEKGAEQLLPFGDMLFSDAGCMPVRMHTAYISDEELVTITDKLRG
nr:DNA translocase FtsK [Candidatus Enterousia merdequi]